MGRHLGIDFSSILVDSGRQLGRQNRPKIDTKRRRKNDADKKGWAKVDIRRSDTSRNPRPRAFGRSPPFKAGQAPRVTGTGPLASKVL